MHMLNSTSATGSPGRVPLVVRHGNGTPGRVKNVLTQDGLLMLWQPEGGIIGCGNFGEVGYLLRGNCQVGTWRQ